MSHQVESDVRPKVHSYALNIESPSKYIASILLLSFISLCVSGRVMGATETSICFDNPNNFNSPTVHVWNSVPANAVTESNWPGHSMSADGSYYCYDPGVSVTSLNVIFSNSGSNQTSDLSLANGNQCYSNGSWTSLSACGLISNGGGGSSNGGSTFVYAKNLGFTPYAHYFDVVPTTPDTSWPGILMTDIGSGVFRVEIPVDASSVGLVFSNNGSAQTSDLTYNGGSNNCYDNGTWKTLSSCQSGSGGGGNGGGNTSTLPRTAFVHLFEWKWTDIAQECEDFLGPKGFSAVQVSPPSEHIQGDTWWTRYQPVSYELQSRGGTRAEFIDMVNRCGNAGVDIYVDAVINHMAGGSGTGTAGSPYSAGNNYDIYSSQDFNQPTCWIQSSDYGNNADAVRNCGLPGLPDLATGSEYVRSRIAEYMNDLISIGVAGFRIDASKHMWPGDIQNILSRLNGNPYIFQEVIDLGGEAVGSGEYTHIGNVTEFKYAGDIGNTFKNGSLDWFNNFGEPWGFMASSSAVVFTDNHDNQRGHGAGGANILTYKDAPMYDIANVFMLTWPYGYPKVMSSYEFTDTEVKGPNSSIHGNGDVNCFNEWKCEHRWRGIANAVAFRNHTVDRWEVTDWWSNGSNQIAYGRGNLGFVVINDQGDNLTRTFNTSLAAGTYCNTFDSEFNESTGDCAGESVTVNSDGTFNATVEAHSALMIHVGAITGQPTENGHGNNSGANTGGAPTANAGADITITVGESAQFNGTASTDADGSITGYSWSNGLAGAQPSLVYNTAGTFTVTLTVTDNSGLQDTDTVTVTVVPEQDAITPTSICFNNPNNFSSPTIHVWDSVPANAVAESNWPGHAMTQTGNFYCYDPGVAVTSLNVIFSDNGASQTTDLTTTGINQCYNNSSWVSLESCGFVVRGPAPVANAGADISIEVGESAFFDGSASSDADGNITSYAWSNGLNSATGSRVYDTAGVFTVTLTVTDNDGQTGSDTVTVTVTEPVVYNYPTGKALFFHNANGWGNPTAHLWNSLPSGNTADTAWPGNTMVDFGGFDLVYVDISESTVSGNVVFSNNGQSQTNDLNYSGDNLCYREGAWTTLEACGVPINSQADAGGNRTVNRGVRLSLTAAASETDTTGARWTSDAWSGELTGSEVVTPVLNTSGNFTVTLTLANNHADTFTLNVVEPTQGLAERPLLAAPLNFPLTGSVDSGNYQYVSAFPNLEGFFSSPVMVTNDGLNQNLIYVVDKPGQLYVFPNDPDVRQDQVVALLDNDFHRQVRDYHEQGLLSVAFHPNFANNRLIYLYYVEYTGNAGENNDYNTGDPEWNGNEYDAGILARFRLNDAINPTSVEAGSFREILRIASTNPDHKGGMMDFHPDTGEFFMSIGEMGYGDSATANPTTGLGRVNPKAQDLTNLAGTFIRVNMTEGDSPDPSTNNYYTIPSDNPFVDRNDGTRHEIWSYGHRNPWRWAFDSVADINEDAANQYTIWEGEIGQDGSTRYEEINIIRKGGNYGWPICEGVRHRGGLGGDHNNQRSCTGDLTGPVSGYGNEGGVSIIGGVVYRGDKLTALQGKYIFGDYFTKTLWTIEKGQQKEVLSTGFPGHISSFGTDVSGDEIFISTHGIQHGGPSIIFKMELDGPTQAAQIPERLSETGIFAELASQTPVHGVIEYGLNSEAWFDGATTRRFMAVPNAASIDVLSTNQWDLPVGSVLVKHIDLPTGADTSEPFETSVLFKQEGGNWEAANYAWNAEGTEATLVRETQININKQQWLNGSQVTVNRKLRAGSACATCHTGTGSKNPRDMETRQLNRSFSFQGYDDNQVDVFSAVGLLSGSPSSEAYVNPADTTADINERALVYLDTNCSSCHFGGSNGEGMNHLYDTPYAQRNLDDLDRLIPFDHAASRLYIHQTSDNLRMPMDSTITNPVAEQLFSAWIEATDVEAQGPTSFTIQPGQLEVPPGSQVQLTATSVYSNGFQVVPSTGVSWSTTNNNVLAVSGNSGTLTTTAGSQGSAVVSASFSGSSADANITVNAGPASPTNFNATATSSSVINLTWQDNANDEDNYLISRGTEPSGPFTLLDPLPANATSFADTGLQATTRYYYQLVATNSDGDSVTVSADDITHEVVEIDSLEIVSGTTITLIGGEQRQVVAVSTDNGERAAATLGSTWSSANNSIASVSAGMITGGNTAGSTTITAAMDNVSDTITVTNAGAGQYVYFQQPEDWNQFKIYLWRVEGSSETTVTQAWPGDDMEPAIEFGGRWFRYPVLAADANSAGQTRVIFNCGSNACETAAQTLNQNGPAWYDGTQWLTQAPVGELTQGGTQVQVLRGEVTLAGSGDLSGSVFPVGSTINFTADSPASGQEFGFWQGAGIELMVDPSSPNTTMVIDGALSYSFAAIMNDITDEHVVGRNYYNAGQTCSSCHGQDGSTPVGSSQVNLVNIGDRLTLEQLITIIEDDMPQGNAGACVGECASSVAAMLMDGAFFPPENLCSADDLDPQDRSYRLLTTTEYNNSIRDLFRLSSDVHVTDSVPADVPANGYYTNANMLFSSNYAAGYITASQQAAGLVSNIYSLVSCSHNDVNCFINEFGKRAFRRPLTSTEVSQLNNLHSREGDSALLAGILSSPSMLLRSEVGNLIGSGENQGRYQLTDYEIASFLSYTFWATTPDDNLMQHADRGELRTTAQISDALSAMLEDHRANETFERFVMGWLGLEHSNPVPDAELSASLKEAMIEETVRFVKHVVFSGGGYDELITANYSFMNQELANHYGITWPGGSGWQQVFYPATGPNSERRGVLGHGSILSVTSAGQKTHPVRRGLFVRQNLMCQDFGAPPIGAALDPETRDDETVRERFERNHAQSGDSCAFCHQHIDGVGFAFENYTPTGLWATTEVLGNGSVVNIDSSGYIGNLDTIETVLIAGEPTTPFQGIDELADLIAGSTNGRACYARQWYRYTRGQREESGDSCTLKAYAEEFKADTNTSLLQLMIDYTQTSNFSLRK